MNKLPCRREGWKVEFELNDLVAAELRWFWSALRTVVFHLE